MAATILPTMILMAVSRGVPGTISAASIGIPDTFFLMLLALIVFGPRRLPEIGRQIGKLMYEFRKVSNDFKFQMEEELRASEEADRIRKLEAVQSQQPAIDVARLDVASLDVPPHPVLESEASQPLEITSGSESASESTSEAISAEANIGEDVAPALEGEVRAEASAYPSTYPGIQPPASGETIAAQKPFRHRVAEPTTESGDPATHEIAEPLVIADEGRVGTEVQPGTEISPRVEAATPQTGSETGTAQAVHHG